MKLLKKHRQDPSLHAQPHVNGSTYRTEPFALSQQEHFISGSHDIFDLLTPHTRKDILMEKGHNIL